MTALDDAWQAALAAEHQAAFGYALLGPRLSGDDRALAVACSDAHEALRDATAAAIAAAGLVPDPPQADYPALYPVAGARRGPRPGRAARGRLRRGLALPLPAGGLEPRDALGRPAHRRPGRRSPPARCGRRDGGRSPRRPTPPRPSPASDR